MKRTLNMIVAEILTQRKGEKWTGRELAEFIVKNEHEFIAKKVKKTGKKEKVLVFQLMSEIGAQFPKIKQYSITKSRTRPCTYYYRERKNAAHKRIVPTLADKQQ